MNHTAWPLLIKTLILLQLSSFQPDLANAAFFGSNFKSLSRLFCPERLKPVEPAPPLSPKEINQIGLNVLELNRLSGNRYLPDNFGDPKIWGAMLDAWVTPFATPGDSLDLLRRVFSKKYASNDELFDSFSAWVASTGLEGNLTPDELIQSAWKKRLELDVDLPEFSKTQLIARNGFIAPEIYARFGRTHFIGADPHDFVSHVIALSDPAFTATFMRYLDLIHTLSRPVESTSKIVLDTRYALSEWLGRFTRDITHENWTYLRKTSAGKTSLFASGGWPFNFIQKLKQNRYQDAAYYLVGYTSLQAPSTTHPFQLLKSLPQWDVFLSNPQNLKTFNKLESYFELLGVMDSISLDDITRDAKSVVDVLYDKLRMNSNFEDTNLIRELMEIAGTEIEKKPRLKRIFQREMRLDFFKTAVEISDTYLQWARVHIDVFVDTPAKSRIGIGKTSAYKDWSKNMTNSEKKSFLTLFDHARYPEELFIKTMRILLSSTEPETSARQISKLDPRIVKNLLHMSRNPYANNEKLGKVLTKLLESGSGPGPTPIQDLFIRLDMGPLLFAYVKKESVKKMGFILPEGNEHRLLTDFLIYDIEKTPELVRKITDFDQLTH